MLELIFIEGGNRGETLRLSVEKVWLGRQTTCDFVLSGEDVSPVHCSIERRGGEFFIVDNKSSSGTFVNRARVHEAPLRSGDQITIGSNQIVVREAGAAAVFRFLIEIEESAAQVIEAEELVIGRKSACQVQLDDLAVSAEHARLDYSNGKLEIIDISSGAGIYLNGQRVVRHMVEHGDVLQIKPFEITFSRRDEKCVLAIRRLVQDDSAKPSVGISAPAQWAHDKAPVWVPTTDLLAGKFPKLAVALALSAALGLGAYLWSSFPLGLSPGPLTRAHGDLNCTSCHTSAGSQRVASCQGCHSAIQPAKHKAALAHVRNRIDCASCHAEHVGRENELVRSVASGCQSAGCHVTVHQKEKLALASRKIPAPELRIPAGEAFQARLASMTGKVGDVLHDKHTGILGAECTVCHTDQKGLAKVDPKVMQSRCIVCHFGAIQRAPIPGGSPLESSFQSTKTHPDDPMHARHDRPLSHECGNCHTDGNPSIAVSRQAMRMRCLSCHGFGEESTIDQRCHRCHFQHLETNPEKIRGLLEGRTVAAKSKAGQYGGLWLAFGMLILAPLSYLAFLLVRQKRRQARGANEIREQVDRAAAAVPRGIQSAEAAPLVHIAPAKVSEHQRPSIDLDLCVGCGLCVTVCPFDVLEVINEKAIAARMDDCTGYAACAAECPTDAIQLVTTGPLQSQSLPLFDESLESNVPGLYLAGEVIGKGLIKAAINQGKQVANSILANPPAPGNRFDVVVVGSGPAGTSVALAIQEAGLKVKVLEQGTLANTIRNYPRQKFVMAEPVAVPLFGPLWIEDSSKETLLNRWQEIVSSTGLVIDEGVKVLGVERTETGFRVLTSMESYEAGRVVLAVGRRGSPRRLGVPGEDLAKVAYSMLDADAYQGQAICVVGGGDSALETAVALSRPSLGNRVSLVHRAKGFDRANPKLVKKLKRRIDDGSVTVMLESEVVGIEEHSIRIMRVGSPEVVENDFVLILIGGEGPHELLASCGIEIARRSLG